MLGLGETDEQIYTTLKCKSDFCVHLSLVSKRVGGEATEFSARTIQIAIKIAQ